jgi:hypothetical protein
MPVLRVILAGLGIAAIAGAAFAVVKGAPFPVLIAPGLFGVMFIFGALYERVSYKTPLARAPGRGFIATPERFVDPSSGRLVEVHVKPATGERAYVDIGPAPPHENG